MTDALIAAKPRLRAHFVGAPSLVPAGLISIQERFAATGYNTGNLLIGDAVARLLDVEVVSSGTTADLQRLKTAVDLIVIPSANFLSPAMDLSWLLPIVEGTTQPILMVGVGAQFPTADVQNAELPAVTLRLMRAVSGRSRSIGVRGQFTAELLSKYGIHNTRVIGCPSIFRLGRPTLRVRAPAAKGARTLFNGSSNVVGHAYSSQYAKRAEIHLLEMAMALEAPYVLQNELPEMKLAAGEVTAEAVDGCLATLKRLGAEIDSEKYLKYVRCHARSYFEVERWAQIAGQYELSIGTRFHGNIIALSQGVAAAIVAHDSRTIELCEALRLPFLRLEQFSRMSLDEVARGLDFTAFENHYPQARKNLAEFLDENVIPHRLYEVRKP